MKMLVSDRPNNCPELVATVRAPALSSVFNQQRYSDIKRLFRVTAFVFLRRQMLCHKCCVRFLHNLKSRKNGMAATGLLSTDEYTSPKTRFSNQTTSATFTKFFNWHGLIVVKYGATLREMRFAIQA